MFDILCALFMILIAILILRNDTLKKIPSLITIPAVINTFIAITNAGVRLGSCFRGNVNPSKKLMVLIASILFLGAAFFHGSIAYRGIFKRGENE